jgi:UrcA family protein
MSVKLSRGVICGSIACITAAMGFGFTAPAQAQPYYDEPTYADQGAEVGGLIVTAPYHRERTYNGMPVERVTASRVVDISDLDLSTGWGVHELRARVQRAAVEACDEVDRAWVIGRYPLDSDSDCYHDAVRRAMRDAPISVDADYVGE